MMKNTILGFAAVLMASCTPALKVDVANTTQLERDDETVEIAWSEVAALEGVTPENVVVLNDDGEQIPSQVLFRGTAEPQALIFQTDADPMETKRFKIVTGVRENYDDYAWENNKVAYRLYGPALETSPEKLITPGIDVWVKCTDKLVIDEWYARGKYHHNFGDGMDCYKVGVTLGSGASLPFVDGKFWMMDHNYATARTLDNGPIRTTVELTYAPFNVDGTPVSLTKTISLDANQRFNRMDNVYEGDFAEMPIAAGFVRHDVKRLMTGDDCRSRLGLEEPRTRRRHLPGCDPARRRDAGRHAGSRRGREEREAGPDADLLCRFGMEPGRRGGYGRMGRGDRHGAGRRRESAPGDRPQIS